MALLAQTTTYDAITAFRYQQLVRHRQSHLSLRPLSTRFWRSPILRRWSSSQESDIALILGNYHSRFSLRNLVVDVIEQLQTARVPVLLATKPAAQVQDADSGGEIKSGMNLSELMSNLILQALQAARQQHQHYQPGSVGNVQTERSMARICAQYLGSESPEELFQLLEAVLCEIHGQVYLVVDLGVLKPEQQQQQDVGVAANNHSERVFKWVESFLVFFAELSSRSNNRSAHLKQVVKVLLVSYDAFPPICFGAAAQSVYVVRADTEVVTARNRKTRRHIAAKQGQRWLNLSRLQQRKAA